MALRFPFAVQRNGRIGKIYKLGNGSFKTYFQFQGAPKQNTFGSFQAAHKFLVDEFEKIDTSQIESQSLYPLRHDRRVYAELEDLLREQGDGATLKDAVDYFLANRKHKRLQRKKVSECIAEYMTAQKGLNISAVQIRTLDRHFRRFSRDFGNRALDDLSAAEITNWLGTQKDEENETLWSASTRKKVRGSLVALSLYAQNILRAIPDTGKTEFQKVRNPKPDARPAVEIYTPDELHRLLLAAIKHDVSLIPSLVMGGLQGLRPFEFHGETLERGPIRWEAINWNDNILHVENQKIRSKATRDIPLHRVSHAWLRPFNELKGPMWTYRKAHDDKFKTLRDKANVPSIHDGLRHSYASYRIRQLEMNLSKLAYEMGNSPEEILRSYKRNVSDAQADAWFNVFPPPGYTETITTALHS